MFIGNIYIFRFDMVTTCFFVLQVCHVLRVTVIVGVTERLDVRTNDSPCLPTK